MGLLVWCFIYIYIYIYIYIGFKMSEIYCDVWWQHNYVSSGKNTNYSSQILLLQNQQLSEMFEQRYRVDTLWTAISCCLLSCFKPLLWLNNDTPNALMQLCSWENHNLLLKMCMLYLYQMFSVLESVNFICSLHSVNL